MSMTSRPGILPGRWLVVSVAFLGAVAIAAAARHLAFQTKVQATEPLTAYVPQGSLMAVEAPDFAGLLTDWTTSAEEKAWVKSDSYAEFSRSRLFSRLGEAQSEFAASAGLAPDAGFLSRVAGKESVFAWYDIGKLEFLYVTRMKPGEAANNPLMKLAEKFQLRKAGADSFYVRAEAGGGGASSSDASPTAGSGEAARTVAFAVHGDLLLLATREDLIANALLLAQHQGDATLANEPWYTTAISAVNTGKDQSRPDMRMTLNLTKIVPSPYFRSYWVQRNVTEMKRYSAAVSDLYREKNAFREERVLIAKSPDMEITAGDLRPVLKYLPADLGVYRATTGPGTAEIVKELELRLLSRERAASRDVHVAPVADLSAGVAGSSGDLDTRIDEQPVPELPMTLALDDMRELLDAARPDAMLVYSTACEARPSTEALFLPVHAAVVLSASAPWDLDRVKQALISALKPRLTVGGAGLMWQTREERGESFMQLSGFEPIAIAVRGDALVVASDPETLLRMLQRAKEGTPPSGEYSRVMTAAGFSHTGERVSLLQLSGLLDRGHGNSPAFFSGNGGGLSQAFKSLDAETLVQGPAPGGAVRQTVMYRWVR